MYASLLAPMKPPSPMERAPAMSSAKPPKTTTLVSPRYASPAVSAKGTVMPSEIPMMASEIMRGLTRRFFSFWPSRSDSDVSSLSTSLLLFSSGIWPWWEEDELGTETTLVRSFFSLVVLLLLLLLLFKGRGAGGGVFEFGGFTQELDSDDSQDTSLSLGLWFWLLGGVGGRFDSAGEGGKND